MKKDTLIKHKEVDGIWEERGRKDTNHSSHKP
jgi:hypothetical protein